MIRNELYTKYLGEISSLAEKLSDVLENLPGNPDTETMEETGIRHSLYRAAETLNNTQSTINYFKKGTREGILVKLSTDKFEIEFSLGDSHQLSCGSSLEVYLKDDREDVEREEGWYCGRVEHNDGYYFCGPGNPKLVQGMRVRIRK